MKDLTRTKTLLQAGRHQGTVIATEFDKQAEELHLDVAFDGGRVKLPYTMDVLSKSGRDMLQPVAGRISDTSELIGKQYWFIVKLHLLQTSGGNMGLNTIEGTRSIFQTI